MDEPLPAHDVDEAALAHLERLARLVVEPSEREALTRDLVELLGFVDQLLEVDVDGVEEFGHAADLTLATRLEERSGVDAERPDVVATSLPTAVALDLAPEAADGFFRVPRTVDEG